MFKQIKKNKMAGKERELVENERVRPFCDTHNRRRGLKQAVNRL